MLLRLIEGIYMPHGYCLLWEPWLITIHAASDLLTFAAYSAIPIAIWIFVKRRTDLELKGLALLFAAFILWCGLTHLFGLITLWHPVYELQGLVKAITAGVSVTTAFLIFPLIPKALAIPSPRLLQQTNDNLLCEIAAHRRTLAELEDARRGLEQRVAERTAELQLATERFRQLFEHAPVAMLMVGSAGSIAQANGAAQSLLGTEEQTLIGASIDTVLPRDVPQPPAPAKPFARGPHDALVGDRSDQFARRMTGQLFPVEIGRNLLQSADEPATIVSIVDITARRRHDERIRVVMRELTHRSKNLLAVIQAMARQVAAASADVESFERGFGERLQGLARSHDLLVGQGWEGVALADLVRAQVSMAASPDRAGITIEGPEIILTPEAAQAIGMAVHELTTNALKHGAWAHGGSIRVSWAIAQGDEPVVELNWREQFGTSLEPPTHKGFGRVVLERVVPRSLRGEARLEMSATELSWALEAAFSALTRAEGEAGGLQSFG